MNSDQMINQQTKLSELARERRSPRAYDSRPVEDYKLNQLFETARWAPSMYERATMAFCLCDKRS